MSAEFQTESTKLIRSVTDLLFSENLSELVAEYADVSEENIIIKVSQMKNRDLYMPTFPYNVGFCDYVESVFSEEIDELNMKYLNRYKMSSPELLDEITNCAMGIFGKKVMQHYRVFDSKMFRVLMIACWRLAIKYLFDVEISLNYVEVVATEIRYQTTIKILNAVERDLLETIGYGCKGDILNVKPIKVKSPTRRVQTGKADRTRSRMLDFFIKSIDPEGLYPMLVIDFFETGIPEADNQFVRDFKFYILEQKLEEVDEIDAEDPEDDVFGYFKFVFDQGYSYNAMLVNLWNTDLHSRNEKFLSDAENYERYYEIFSDSLDAEGIYHRLVKKLYFENLHLRDQGFMNLYYEESGERRPVISPLKHYRHPESRMFEFFNDEFDYDNGLSNLIVALWLTGIPAKDDTFVSQYRAHEGIYRES